MLSITLFCMLFIGAGVIHTIYVLDNDSFHILTDFDFFAALYFNIVTLSTVGYGDIYPLSTVARFGTVFLIITMIYIVSDQLTKIAILMDNYSKYDTYYQLRDHVIIVGSYRISSLFKFLVEFYHSDHGHVDTHVLLIGDSYPSYEIIRIMENPRFEGNISYLEGPL